MKKVTNINAEIETIILTRKIGYQHQTEKVRKVIQFLTLM